MFISESNYIKRLQGIDGLLNEACRFLKRTKKGTAPQVISIQRDLRNVITKEIKGQRQQRNKQLLDKQKKKND